MKPIRIGPFTIDDKSAALLIAGPCVIEDEQETLRLAEAIAGLAIVREFNFVFKASYLKDNRSAASGYRGPGVHEGLKILEKVRDAVGCPVLSDVHSLEEVEMAAPVLDVVQIPAMLSRQTRLLEAAGKQGKAINIKKGQFLSPEGAVLAVEKVRGAGGENIFLSERGTTFGYNDLVVDFRSFARMSAAGVPVVFDVTHSLQRPGGLGDRSGGEPELVGMMARAAAAVPCDGFFIETHPEPAKARSDGASMLPFSQLEQVLIDIHRIFTTARELKTGSREFSRER